MLNYDISRCTNETCPLDCRRKEPGSDYQSCACFAPEKPNDYRSCKYLIEEKNE